MLLILILDICPRGELSKGGMGLDPNDATMGPIMDSLIMTSNIKGKIGLLINNKTPLSDDRPYVDCATLTPMTGTGLVKFERYITSCY